MITLGLSSVVGLALISSPGNGVVVVLVSLISFFRPLRYTGLIIVFSISSVLSSTLFPNTVVLHLSQCSAVMLLSSNCSGCTDLPSFLSGFPPVVIRGSEILGSKVCLFVFYILFCLYPLLLCVWFSRFVVSFRTHFQIYLCCVFSQVKSMEICYLHLPLVFSGHSLQVDRMLHFH